MPDNMLHGRERNEAIKRIVAELGTVPKTAVRVELGKGTARRWATITTPSPLDILIVSAVTKRLIDESLIGTYCGDYGIDGDVYPCVHFEPRKVVR